MDFARKILQNYGWKDGEGLGKHKDGIAKPLRATLKFDKTGFGADQAASDFNNHWWERVYNEAAENVNVTEEDDEIKMALRGDGNGVEISTKGYSMKKLKERRGKRNKNKSGYDNFYQTATLTNLGSEVANQDKINTKDIEVLKVNVLTDEELFKACGGRTAHKGARHGLKLSGKLLRVEQQEAELLATLMAKRIGLSKEGEQTRNKLETNGTKSKNIVKQSAEHKKLKNKTLEKTNEMFYVRNDIPKKKKRKHCEVNSETAVIESKQKEVSCNNTETNKNKVEHCNTDLCLKENDGKQNSAEKKKRKNKKLTI